MAPCYKKFAPFQTVEKNKTENPFSLQDDEAIDNIDKS